jgi:hypothetical protein
MAGRRFPPPGRSMSTVSFIINDATGPPLAYLYF